MSEGVSLLTLYSSTDKLIARIVVVVVIVVIVVVVEEEVEVEEKSGAKC